MSVVSNASPLINLARIGQLRLLHEVYGEIVIPEAVRNEVVREGTGQPGAAELEQANWVEMQPVSNRLLVQALRQDLDAGEAEAIVLALELKADLLLMDERLGRQVARHLGVAVTGLIGLCLEAKHKGIILAVKPLLNTLRDQAGFHIRQSLYEQVLADAGEKYGSFQ
jgi:predicted nucleic acid-binding protein